MIDELEIAREINYYLAFSDPSPTDREVRIMVKKLPTRLEKHGHVRVDEYYWLRERENPEAIAYLKAENERAEKELAHTKAFEEKLFEEIKARIKQTDMSVPYRRDGYYYYTRYEEGKEYPILSLIHI